MQIKESSTVEKLLDKEGKLWDIVIIREGYSKNRDRNTGFPRYYPAEALKQMVPMFEGASVYAYNWGKRFDEYNHLPAFKRQEIPEGAAFNKIGWLSDVHYVESFGDEGNGALIGKCHLVDKALREKLVDAWKDGNKEFLGFSIDVEGRTNNVSEDGHMVQKVVEVYKANELTLVDDPAAGGKLVRLVASTNFEEGDYVMKDAFKMLVESNPELAKLKEDEQTADALLKFMEGIRFEEPLKASRTTESDALQENLKAMVAKVVEAIKAGNSEDALKMLTELVQAYGEPKNGEYPYPAKESDAPEEDAPAEKPEVDDKPDDKEKKVEGDKKVSENTDRIAELEKKVKLGECETVLREALAKEITMPEATKKAIRKQFEGKLFEAEDLKETIKNHKEMLVALTESGEVKNLGGQGRAEILLEKVDKCQRAIDLMIDPEIQEEEKDKYKGITPFRSLLESWEHYVGDQGGRMLMEGKCLQEASSSNYPLALGTSMNRKLAKLYKRWPANWKKIVTINNDVKNFKQQEVNRWGGFSQLPDVTEDALFSTVANPYEVQATYTPGQKGWQWYVTRKFILNDDLRLVRQVPEKANQAATTTLDHFVFDLLLNYTVAGGINAGTIYDGLALYHANHFNLGSDALGYDSLNASINRMMNQWEYGAKDALNEALDDSETDVDVDDGTKFQVGEYILVDAEIMKVTAISTNTLTVVRAQLGTTAATHLDNALVYVLTDQLGIEPKYAVVQVNQREAIEQYTKNPNKPGTGDRDINNLRGRLEPIVVPITRFRGDANDFVLVADPNMLPSIEIGFVGGQETPELLVQDAPTVGDVFKYQRMTYRLLHEYGGAAIDWRGLDGNIVA